MQRLNRQNARISACLLRQYVKRRFEYPPIILGGAPRSGTTLLLAILGSHPHIYSIDYETASLHPRLRPLKLLKFLLLESKTQIRHIPKGKLRFCEKTPGNILHGPEIIDLFDGEIRIINIFRDGRDVVTSRHPLRPDEYWVKISTWTRYVEHGLKLQKYPQALSIRYEDLVTSPAVTLRTICEFLDEEFDQRMLTHHEHTNVKSNLAWFGSAEQIKGASVRKWERPEFAERLKEFMSDEKARMLSSRLGYISEFAENGHGLT